MRYDVMTILVGLCNIEYRQNEQIWHTRIRHRQRCHCRRHCRRRKENEKERKRKFHFIRCGSGVDYRYSFLFFFSLELRAHYYMSSIRFALYYVMEMMQQHLARWCDVYYT